VVVVVGLALLGALSGTADAALSGSRVSEVAFTNANLQNGWNWGALGTAYPGYVKDSLGVVHLRGSVVQGPEGHAAFVLPKALAPSHEMWLPTLMANGQSDALIISSTGQVIPDGFAGSYYQSVDAISFVAASVTKIRFTNAKLQNGWKYGGGGSAQPGYAIDPLGVVRLRGGLFDGTSGTTAFVLPKALRPSHPIWLPIYTSGFTAGSLSVSPNGEVTPSGDAVAGYASLDGINFTAGSSAKIRFTNAKLQNGWKYGGYSSALPGYGEDSHGFVHLRGAVRAPQNGSVTAFTLPRGLRPSHLVEFPIYTLNGTEGLLQIFRDGEVAPRGNPSDLTGYASLDGISFAAGQ
jgi:hypothetical protein